MPKDRSNRSYLLRKWIECFDDNEFKVDGSNIFCCVCGKKITCEKKFQLQQHSETANHIALKSKSSRQQLVTTCFSSSGSSNEFNFDLCTAMVSANISFKKLNNKVFKEFIFKYIKKPIPDESTIRKNYLDVCYKTTIEKIRKEIGNSIICHCRRNNRLLWSSRCELLSRKSIKRKAWLPYLISCKVLEKTNSSSISRFINDSLQNILVDRKTGETNFYVLLSDAAPYMIAAGDSLKVFYPRLIHVTCTIHGIHRLSEVIIIYFANVNKLISSTKKVFLNKNKGLPTLKIINDYGVGKGVILPHEFPAKVGRSFKYCPLTSVDVERHFRSSKTY